MKRTTIQTTELLQVESHRKYLLDHEVDKLIDAARRSGRNGSRDSAMILLMYRHGLRVSEAIDLRWDQIDFETGRLHVWRLKNGDPSVQPLAGVELRALKALKKQSKCPYVFQSERGGQIERSVINRMIQRASKEAELGIDVNPHMLRHSTGYQLANKGFDTRSLQHYLGHKNIQNTVIYTKLSAERFKGVEKLL